MAQLTKLQSTFKETLTREFTSDLDEDLDPSQEKWTVFLRFITQINKRFRSNSREEILWSIRKIGPMLSPQPKHMYSLLHTKS